MLAIKNLNKRYGKFQAVSDLNLEVAEGEIFGFVGPNGAGKTTTMKIICGLLRATSGEITLDGVDIIRNSRRMKEKIGYMPDFFGVYDDLKVSEYLEFYASIYNIKGQERKRITDDLLELVDLGSKREAYVDSLSRGMKQRLCLARSLVHNPRLLVLDEPASGMDPRARFEMKEILKNLKGMGKTIIISSHILPELAELCTSIGIIDQGRMVISGSNEEIMQQVYNKKVVRLKVTERLDDAVLILKEYPFVDKLVIGENTIQAGFGGGDGEMSRVLSDLINRGIPVVSFSQMDGNLEDVFMKVTKGEEEQ
ncbi:MAG TPA: ABC transporter ATP-binding protein [Bacillota bacterium]|nr:ABC transporter ATP-binding protein [Bacillota bacterium]HRS22459.1 ABC transporter ATP-binding protein [Clostridia bacterium]HRU42696.1 ABC transporter ATP-binding protein [Candidatus Diapherotrites archaeon]HQE65913.1 ABC transporter ATP-binding protein [Bacillota bacterium]HQI15907.1 ABC transporter ATP-binding protein [Bacillota bacterium]